MQLKRNSWIERSDTHLPFNHQFDPATGVTLHGDVLTGKFTAKDAIQREADRSGHWDNLRTPCPPGDYDPVLKHHLRLSDDS